jgi:anti-sigma28 factor (negative regulator of flagellin synthesis)
MRITDRYQSLMDRSAGAKGAATSAAAKAQQAERAAESTRAEGSHKTSDVMQVNVSARARELSAGAARLTELREAVQNGTFKVDADAIAARLVGEDA